MKAISEQPARLLKMSEVLARLGISSASWKRGVKSGRFPRGVRITERRVGWPEHQIEALVQRLARGEAQ